MEPRPEIEGVLRGITAAWRAGRLKDLPAFYRPDVVFSQPAAGARLTGVEACVGSYRDFLATATVHAYEEEAPAVDVFGNTAVATVRFTIDYELASGRFQESGHDLVVLVRDEAGLRVQWRTLLSDAPPA
jgi:ketosteroid isomerase-like protein